ncbi:MAG: DUF3343 domain-containing protein [Lachnospiraceae bacterium]|nr:DUF3343 domain-containing protein [Lachnospiraceae bacterium]
MIYIATFYSHFGAIRFKREALSGIQKPQLMPVPRNLSSSCGTCVRFEADADYQFAGDVRDEIEQIVRETELGYVQIYAAREK